MVQKEFKKQNAKEEENKCPDSYSTAAFACSQLVSAVIQLPLLNHFLNSEFFVIVADLTSFWSRAMTQKLFCLPTVDAISKLKRFPIALG